MSNKGLKRIVIVLSVLVIIFPLTTVGMMYYKLNSMYDSTTDDDIFGSEDYKSEKGITNILLCGTDARPGETSSRTDAMMILTVDGINKSLKLTSLARDTYVTNSKGSMKLTEAHAYGGMNLLTESIEENFEIDIQNYALVDFYSFMDIIDTLGGITVEVKENELSELNKFITETHAFNTNPDKGSIEYINSSGEQKLNGYQALSYARIRKGSSGGTEERDRRQREVIEGLMMGVKDLSITKYPSLLDTILPYVKTNMKPLGIIDIAGSILKIGNFDITQMEFPINDGVLAKNDRINGKAVITFSPDSISILHDFIFDDIIYQNN